MRTLASLMLTFILSGCAGNQAVRPDPGPARQAEATRPPARIILRALPGWETRDTLATLRGEQALYVDPARHAVMNGTVVPARGLTPDAALDMVADALRGAGCRISDRHPAEGARYASARFAGTFDGQRTRGIIAVRQPGGRSDLLLVLQAAWRPHPNDDELAEQVDLMFLLATVE